MKSPYLISQITWSSIIQWYGEKKKRGIGCLSVAKKKYRFES